MLALREGQVALAPPDVVVWPQTTREVIDIVRVAIRLDVPIVPWGAGSGVCGGAMAVRGGILVDLKRMNAIEEIVPEDGLARCEAGILGQTLEDTLNLHGQTLGHFPSSIHCSTLGGWLATRSAGQASSRYGKIEDLTEALSFVSGEGQLIEARRGDHPDLVGLLLGSEGTLGIITRATLRIRPVARARAFRGYRFPRVAAGCEGMRRIMQRGLRPAILRLYDELDTLIAGGGSPPSAAHKLLLSTTLGLISESESASNAGATAGQGDGLRQRALRFVLKRAGLVNRFGRQLLPKLSNGCLLILGVEGDDPELAAELSLCHAELSAAGGIDLGEGPGLRWYQHRYSVAHKQSPLYQAGGFVDTMEVATTWSNLLHVYERVKAAFDEGALVMAHFSHAYSEGCSIYFTFAAAGSRAQAEQRYDELWRKGLGAVVRSGATISHHHGIGLSKAGFIGDELGNGVALLRQVKQVFDPHCVMNPGKMGS